MWSDNESAIDLLQYGYLARAVTRVVTDPSLSPTTVGIFGDWGGGKTTLLKMVERDLENTEAVLSLSFNGWLFEGYDDAKSALIGTILDAIEDLESSDRKLSDKARTLLQKLTARVNWFRVVATAGAYGLPLLLGQPDLAAPAALGAVAATSSPPNEKLKAPSVDDIEKLTKSAPGGEANVRRNIREFRRDFEKLLSEAGIKTLVVFIDDLDRCLPDTIIATLEAIKLFLFVPGTSFVIAADQRIVKYAVRLRFPELPGTETEVGRDYLEKLIQIPISIPPLSASEIESYMNLLFAQKELPGAPFKNVCEHVALFKASNVTDVAFNASVCREVLKGQSIPPMLDEDFNLVMQIAPVLTRGLSGSPRRTKRFLNTVLLRMQLADDRGLKLDRRVLAKLMLLEYLREPFFRQLGHLQASENGRPMELAVTEDKLRSATSAGPDEVSDVAATKDERSDEGKTRKRPVSAVAKTVAPAPTLQPTTEVVAQWSADPWMKDWLRSDPKLGGVDLRPYFYIAREKVGDLDVPLRLSSHAAEILNGLLDSGELTQHRALGEVASLSEVEASAIFQALSQRLRQSQVLDGNSIQPLFLKFVQRRAELLPQVVAIYGELPDSKLSIATTPALWKLVKGTSADQAGRALLARWSKSSRTDLAGAAKAVLASIAKG